MRDRLRRARSVAVLLALILVSIQGRHALGRDDPAPDLIESEWVGEDAEMITTFRFEKGGTLAYTYNGTSYRNGTWKQNGAKLEFEMNDGYRTFKGDIKGSVIQGDSENTVGKKWKLTMYRYAKPG